ncbi:OmpA family protein [Paracoccus aerodenitrificans]|uniref:OmpA family protein n=1 Tax=Paracoccus aerodenitrificans TaxID=3017781 RepID=UPI0022EFFCE2|nr:OmpA family protein [Paracoccus aerodenitrificans]WBU64617.1 OmpA family protein [Paracoccus aerodenitrificans]
MRNIHASSTAIAALLTLGLAGTAAAEITISAEAAAEQGPIRAEQMQQLATLLQNEVETGMQADDLSCLDGTARPCADDMPLVTPLGISVQFTADGNMILAAPEMQPYLLRDGQTTVRDNALTPLAEAALETAQANLAILREGGSPPPLMPATSGAAADQNPADTAMMEEIGDNVDPLENSDISPEEAAEIAQEVNQQDPMEAMLEEGRETAEAATNEAQQRQDELAKMLEQAQEPEADNSDSATIRDSHAANELRVAEAEADGLQQRRVENMPELGAILQNEVNNGLTADDLVCADGSDRPCAGGIALTSPTGIAADVTENGRIIMAPAAQQQYVFGDNGQLRARGSNSAAAKEAAQAASPAAEALSSDAEGEVVSETVDDARSSDEDFETTIAEAIERAAAAQQVESSASDDDDDNDMARDLARVALAGLGALAVGQVLNGNREVALNTGDRVIVTREDGSQQVLKDDNALLRQSGNEVRTENFSDGSSRSVVTRPDGSQVITIRSADLTVLRRVHVASDGTETVLIDESVEVPPVELSELPQAPAPRPAATPTSEEALREALAREAAIDRRFSLSQVRTIPEVRNLVAPVDIDAITFDTGSAAINPDQARQLATLGTVLEEAIANNPREIFLIEGHTDAVGAATFNLALSDRRAETVALALSEYFNVPPENLVVQGYGEEYLKVPTLLDERENRRASVRRITDLLASAN